MTIKFEERMQRKNRDVDRIFQIVNSKNIITTLDITPSFFDEPKIYSYYSILNVPDEMVSAGSSFFSQNTALLKCLSESVERYCWYCYKSENELITNYKKIKDEALNPSFLSDKISQEKEFSWIKGINTSENKECFIPKELVNFRESYSHKGTFLFQPSISTGCAAGFDHTSTLLRGIYEVIERDAFMTTYLTKVKLKSININSLKHTEIQYISKLCRRYKLELFVFDITTDLQVPVFLTMLVDKTGVGPAISCGAKCSFNEYEAIIGSMTEAFLTRTWLRESIIKNGYSIKPINPDKITTIEQRGLYWAQISNLQNLDYLLNQSEQKMSYKKAAIKNVNQLSKVKSVLSKKGHDIFYVNIGKQVFKKDEYFVYKVIIPTLQPLYLVESDKEKSIRHKRLNEVARFFGKQKYDINTLPHPFL